MSQKGRGGARSLGESRDARASQAALLVARARRPRPPQHAFYPRRSIHPVINANKKWT